MKPVLLVVLFVAVAMVTVSAQKPCCSPEQYMAGIGGTTGMVDPAAGPEAIATYMYGALDFTNRRFGSNMTVVNFNGSSSTFRIIQNWAEGSEWIIIDEYSYCLKQPVYQPEPNNCIPDTATFSVSALIGGPSGILIDSWTNTVHHPQDGPLDGTVTLGVIHGSCLPVSGGFVGNRYDGVTPTPMVSLLGFLNMTMGIPDPDAWFKLPSYCTKENLSSQLPGSVKEAMKYILVL